MADSVAAAAPRRRMSLLPVLVAVLALAVVGLAVAAGLLGARLATLRGEQDDQSEALAAARQAVTNVVSFDYRTLSKQFAVLAADSTGPFRSDLSKYEAAVRQQFTSRHLVSHGVIDDAAVASASGSQASVLVAVDDTITVAGASSSGVTPQRYRMIVTMVHRGGRWLLDNITVAS